jgi:hypothetical protein
MIGGLASPLLGAGLLLGAEVISPDQPFGWLGALLLTALGSFTLWRAGSVKAWKDTAEARYRRIGDLERELGEIHGELAIPERIEGIIRLMSETAQRQDAAATERLEISFERLDRRWLEFNAAAEARSARLEELILQNRTEGGDHG